MPTKFEGLLDRSGLEDVNLNPTNWKARLPTRWSIDLVRPDFIALTLRRSAAKKPARRTAWLDGLRGFAALIVYLHHHQLWAHGLHGNLVFENAFGYEGRHYFAALPFVRNFFAGGHFAVAIFFVISGYVLSYKSLSLIQKGQILPAADSVGSALFRRWLRLYIPVIGITLLWIAQRHWTGIWIDYGEPKENFGAELKNWYYKFKNYSFVYTTGSIYDFMHLYHPHSWTIPMEMKGSVIVYTALTAFSRCTRQARLWCSVGLIFYFLYIVDGWYGAVFCSGMLLCDLDLLALENQLPRFLAALEDFKEFIYFHLFIVALYLGGVPSCDQENYQTLLNRSPGWRFLSHLTPQAVYDPKWFFNFWAALLFVASVPRLPWLKHFFESRFCQYLARISFALYLVHGPLLILLSDRIYAAVGFSRGSQKGHIDGWIDAFPITKKGPMGLELAFWIPQLVLFPVTLYAAEVGTKLLDEPSVRFSNWLYRKAIAPPESPSKSGS
ncbi:acyltransferas-like protein [Westerdykella ornata]|uniref:Acyltransferas-like protein n=1 Tax=Westerdykella ornata TaxID=318751 RepID=A0A6A6JD97_WESOR|nr:acyltransferas-like protein [Westerdykella ornata]KAF2274204.1 acyltransferas-like protein [Westerdykella ornata]